MISTPENENHVPFSPLLPSRCHAGPSLPDAAAPLLTPQLLNGALGESVDLRTSLSPEAVNAARERLEAALVSQAQPLFAAAAADSQPEVAAAAARGGGNSGVIAALPLQQQHVMLRLMFDAAAMTAARASGTRRAEGGQPPGLNMGGVEGHDAGLAAEAVARFSLLRETAERCETDAAQRCIVLLGQVVASAAARGAAVSAATAEGGGAAAGDEEQLPATKRQAVGVAAPPPGAGAAQSGGRSNEPPQKEEEGVLASDSSEEDEEQVGDGAGGRATAAAPASAEEEKQLFAAAMCVARWGQIVAFRSEAQRQEAAWSALLERLRGQADAAAAWIELRAVQVEGTLA